MSDMVERVAAALESFQVELKDDDSGGWWHVREIARPEHWIRFRLKDVAISTAREANARAAINALRDPTHTMRQAGGQAIDGASADDIVDCWRRMIEAALHP